MSLGGFEAPTLINAMVVSAMDYGVHQLRNTGNGLTSILGFSMESRSFSALLQGMLAFFGPQIKKGIEYFIPLNARSAAVEQALTGPLGHGVITFGLGAAEVSPMLQGIWPINRSDVINYGDALENSIQSVGVQSIGLQVTRVMYPAILGRPVPPELS